MSKVTLTILNRPYSYDVSEEDALTLKAAADLLNARAKEITGDTRLLTAERIAVTAALQIAFDSLRGKIGDVPVDPATLTRVATLRMKIDDALDPALEAK